MSAFKFNFSGLNTETENDVEAIDESKDDKTSKVPDDAVSVAREIFPTDYVIENIEDIVIKANVFSCGDLQIGYVLPEDSSKYLKEDGRIDDSKNNIIVADDLHSDLLEGKYEGGLKVWECTVDLADYICDNGISFEENSHVLDLGCGSGILGMIALMSGSRQIHFQDYNEEVLIAATIPNVLLNIPEEKRSEIKTRCKFFAGDWGSFPNLINGNIEQKYDFILTSETIYNPQNYDKIYKIFKDTLKPSGIAFVAAKSYYFGVGGNTKDFEKFVLDDGAMLCESCWKTDNGIPREILKLTFK